MNFLQQFQHRLENSWSNLGTRDQFALLFMAIFLSIALLGSMLWYPHQAAEKERQRLSDLTSTLEWMQTNAVQLPSNPNQDATPLAKVQRIAQQQGLSPQIQEIQGQIKVIVIHEQYAVLANFMTQLGAQGMSMKMLNMQKLADGKIQLTMTLQ